MDRCEAWLEAWLEEVLEEEEVVNRRPDRGIQVCLEATDMIPPVRNDTACRPAPPQHVLPIGYDVFFILKPRLALCISGAGTCIAAL